MTTGVTGASLSYTSEVNMIKIFFIVVAAITANGEPTLEAINTIYFPTLEGCQASIVRTEAQYDIPALYAEHGATYMGMACESFEHIAITTQDQCADCHSGE